MFPKSSTVAALLCVLAVCWPGRAEAAERVDADTIRVGLRTADPKEEAYIIYVVALRDEGILSDRLVESTFQWARRKPHPRKFQYFKYALITQAADAGIRLPQQTPDLTPAIQGRVVVRVLFVDVPAPNVTVAIRGTKRKAVTNARGEFRFANVPYGTYPLEATGIAAFLPRKGSATVVLPPRPPATDSAFVKIRLK